MNSCLQIDFHHLLWLLGATRQWEQLLGGDLICYKRGKPSIRQMELHTTALGLCSSPMAVQQITGRQLQAVWMKVKRQRLFLSLQSGLKTPIWMCSSK